MQFIYYVLYSRGPIRGVTEIGTDRPITHIQQVAQIGAQIATEILDKHGAPGEGPALVENFSLLRQERPQIVPAGFSMRNNIKRG